MLEHYVDGDLVDDSVETKIEPASHDNLHVWGTLSTNTPVEIQVKTDGNQGPDVPATFLE